MKKIVLLLSTSLFLVNFVFSQNVGINSDGSLPDNSAMLDVKSTDKGLLIPRVALTALNAAAPITSPSTSLMIYNTATAGTAPNNVTPGFYFWNGTGWKSIGGAGGKNIYDNDGDLSANRTVTLDGNTLNFTGGKVGVNSTTPNATLDIASGSANSTNTIEGFLIPRVTKEKAARMGLSPSSIPEGLMIYINSLDLGSPVIVAPANCAGILTTGYYIWNGSAWVNIAGSNNLYAVNGTLAGDREVKLNGNDLTFTGKGSIGIHSTTPEATLDIKSGTLNTEMGLEGLLVPRVNKEKALRIAANVPAPTEGMIIFVDDITPPGGLLNPNAPMIRFITSKGHYVWNGTEWEKLGGEQGWLSKITEGGNTGYRILKRNPANYGNIGSDAIDLGYSNATSTSVGATGDYSVVLGGKINTASGESSAVLGGERNTASGKWSIIAGRANTAPSYGEVVVGINATTYTPASATSYNSNDRIFTVGNGADGANKSNALTILKNGNVGIKTTSPTQRLDIDGSLRIRNVSPGSSIDDINRILVVDNSGVVHRRTTKEIGGATKGDVKSGLQKADHNGWFILDGRLISTLNSRQQAAARALFGNTATRIPNTTGNGQRTTTYLGDIDGSKNTVGSIGGNTDNIWIRSDLPNLSHTHTGRTDNAGKHRHTYWDGRHTGRSRPYGGNYGDLIQNNDWSDPGRTTSESGEHNHSFTTNSSNPGGPNSSVFTTNRTLDVNHFVYLGL